MIPCHNDPDAFVSESVRELREAAELCFSCPVFDACRELGMGEEHGTYAGTVHTDPHRVAHRRSNRDDVRRGYVCRNGHPLFTVVDGERVPTEHRVELDGILLPDSNLPRGGCLRCKELRDLIDTAARQGRPDYADLVG